MERISGLTPGGNRPRELALWLGQQEPTLHLWIHPPDAAGGWAVRVAEADLLQALERAKSAGPTSGEGMSGETLLDYFQEGRWRPALRRYAQFAEESGWCVPHRLEMYNLGKLAFDVALDESVRLEAFMNLYESLRGFWRVFNNSTSHWTEEQALEFFTTNAEECGPASVRSLENVSRSEMREVVLPFLDRISEIKTVADSSYPTITASRFLHFFNPHMFPNFDNVLMNQQVLQAFGNDFDRYCADTGIADWEHYAAFYGQFMLWAGRHIQNADPEFFKDFEEWFRAQVEGEDDPNGVLEEAGKYHATAFEYVAIGAAKLTLEG